MTISNATKPEVSQARCKKELTRTETLNAMCYKTGNRTHQFEDFKGKTNDCIGTENLRNNNAV